MVTYLKFAGYLVFSGWILTILYTRYVQPVTKIVYDAMEPEEGKRAAIPKILGWPIRVALAGVQTYALGMWPAYCVARTVRYLTTTPGAGPWGYYFTAFLICEWALGVIARKEPYRGFLSVLHLVLSMGFFAIFAMNHGFLHATYPWIK